MTYRAKRGYGRPLRWAQLTWARLGPHAHPGGLCPPRAPLLYFFGPHDVFLSNKISKKFHYVWTPFVLIFCDVKNKQKTATGTGHWVKRLVPKNDIKLLHLPDLI